MLDAADQRGVAQLLRVLTVILLFGCLTACSQRELGKHYVTWGLSLVRQSSIEISPDATRYLQEVQGSIMESLSDGMRRVGTRDLDKIVWVSFQIDASGETGEIAIQRSDIGAFIGTLCETAVRKARNPPKMSEMVEAELGSPLPLVAVFEFNRPET